MMLRLGAKAAKLISEKRDIAYFRNLLVAHRTTAEYVRPTYNESLRLMQCLRKAIDVPEMKGRGNSDTLIRWSRGYDCLVELRRELECTLNAANKNQSKDRDELDAHETVAQALVDDIESLREEMHKEHGHLCKVDSGLQIDVRMITLVLAMKDAVFQAAGVPIPESDAVKDFFGHLAKEAENCADTKVNGVFLYQPAPEPHWTPKIQRSWPVSGPYSPDFGLEFVAEESFSEYPKGMGASGKSRAPTDDAKSDDIPPDPPAAALSRPIRHNIVDQDWPSYPYHGQSVSAPNMSSTVPASQSNDIRIRPMAKSSASKPIPAAVASSGSPQFSESPNDDWNDVQLSHDHGGGPSGSVSLDPRRVALMATGQRARLALLKANKNNVHQRRKGNKAYSWDQDSLDWIMSEDATITDYFTGYILWAKFGEAAMSENGLSETTLTEWFIRRKTFSSWFNALERASPRLAVEWYQAIEFANAGWTGPRIHRDSHHEHFRRTVLDDCDFRFEVIRAPTLSGRFGDMMTVGRPVGSGNAKMQMTGGIYGFKCTVMFPSAEMDKEWRATFAVHPKGAKMHRCCRIYWKHPGMRAFFRSDGDSPHYGDEVRCGTMYRRLKDGQFQGVRWVLYRDGAPARLSVYLFCNEKQCPNFRSEKEEERRCKNL